MMKTNEPKANAIFVDARENNKTPTYLIKMERDQSATVEELFKKYDANIDKMIKYVKQPFLLPMIYSSFATTIAGVILYIYHFKVTVKAANVIPRPFQLFSTTLFSFFALYIAYLHLEFKEYFHLSKEEILAKVQGKFRILTVDEFLKERKTYLAMSNIMGDISMTRNPQRPSIQKPVNKPEPKNNE